MDFVHLAVKDGGALRPSSMSLMILRTWLSFPHC